MTKTKKKFDSKLANIRNVQHLMKRCAFGAVQLKDNASLLFRYNKPVNRFTQAEKDAFGTVRFKWSVLLGVISRQPDMSIVLTIKQIAITNEWLAEDLNEYVIGELRKLFKQVNQDQRLTTFYIMTPNHTEYVPEQLALELMHKYKVPDLMITKYETQHIKEEDIPNFTDNTDWFNSVKWVYKE